MPGYEKTGQDNNHPQFLAKSQFMKTSGGINKKLPIKSDEESCLVDYMFQISNLTLMKDLAEVVQFFEF